MTPELTLVGELRRLAYYARITGAKLRQLEDDSWSLTMTAHHENDECLRKFMREFFVYGTRKIKAPSAIFAGAKITKYEAEYRFTCSSEHGLLLREQFGIV